MFIVLREKEKGVRKRVVVEERERDLTAANSNLLAKERRKRWCELCSISQVTAALLSHLKCFPSVSALIYSPTIQSIFHFHLNNSYFLVLLFFSPHFSFFFPIHTHHPTLSSLLNMDLIILFFIKINVYPCQ